MTWVSWIKAISTSALVVSSAGAQITTMISIDSGGIQANGCSYIPSISADGRYVAFVSDTTNLVPGDTNGFTDIFVRDRQGGTTERVSVSTSGTQGDSYSDQPSISADGRFVAFRSLATNLVPGDTNGCQDVFVHDRQTGVTERVSVDSAGGQGGDYSHTPFLSADGRYVAFYSSATNLVPGDTNGTFDTFIHDRQFGVTERVSVSTSGTQGNGSSFVASISADGRYVAFESLASNLVSSDTNGFSDVFVHDRQSGLTERVSVNSGGAEGNNSSYTPSISTDGRYVAFMSAANNLVSGDTNGFPDIFVRDRQSAATERVSISTGGIQSNGISTAPSMSADGRYVAFYCNGSNLVGGDTNGKWDVFLRDRLSAVTERMSVSTTGMQGDGDSSTAFASISADGRFVAFWSVATNLVSGDTNACEDVFVRDRDATAFTSLCSPGVGGVLACPCSNPPNGLGRGCDNSAVTGGATLSASGILALYGARSRCGTTCP